MWPQRGKLIISDTQMQADYNTTILVIKVNEWRTTILSHPCLISGGYYIIITSSFRQMRVIDMLMNDFFVN